MDRWEFLVRTAQGAALLAVGGCTIPPRSYKVLEVPQEGLRISLEDYPELKEPGGIVRIVTSRHRAIYVRRADKHRAVALSGVCTHQGCIVSARRSGFRCACHGSTFDASGKNTGGPARLPLAPFEAEVRADAIVVHLKRS